MNRAQVKAARLVLLSRREELNARRESQGAAEQALLELKEPDWAEQSADQVLAGLVDGLCEREREELEEIDLALIRIEAGTWGRCTKCSRPIEPLRLAAAPAVATCMHCGRSSERARARVPSRAEPSSWVPAPVALETERFDSLPPEDLEVPEEPRIVHGGELFVSKVRRRRPRPEDASDPGVERIARRVLEEATEAEVPQPEAPLVEAPLVHQPDDLFPDRVDWPLDEVDEAG